MKLFIKKSVAAFLALIMLLGIVLMPGAEVFAAEFPAEYGLWVNGSQFTSDRLTIPCGSGSAEFSPIDNTLTLTNAAITETSSVSAGICATNISLLSVVLNGSSSIDVSGEYGIASLKGTVTVQDGGAHDGALTVNASSAAIFANSNINIRGTRLNLTASGASGCAIMANDNINITGGTVVCRGSSSDISGKKIAVTGGSLDAVNVTPAIVNGGGSTVGRVDYAVLDSVPNAAVSDLNVSINGSGYIYGTECMFSNESGNVVLWLPEGAIINKVVTTGYSTTTILSAETPTEAPAEEIPTEATTEPTTTASITEEAPVVLPESTATSSGWLKIIGTKVNVRSGAGTSSSVVQQVNTGEWYPFSEKKTVGENTWYCIKIGNSTGWVINTYVEVATAQANYVTLGGTQSSKTINLRGTPGSTESSDILCALPIYASYPYTETKSVNNVTWYKITAGSKVGWVSGSFAQATVTTASSTQSTDSSATSSTQSTTASTTKASSGGWVKISGVNIYVRDVAGSTGKEGVQTQVSEHSFYPYSETTSVNGKAWYKISVGNKSGWISGQYASNVTDYTNFIKVTGTSVNVRSATSTESTIITNILMDQYYPYTETASVNSVTWYKIVVGSKSGWVIGTYAQPVSNGTGGTTTPSAATGSTASTAPAALANKNYVQATAGKINVRNAANGDTIVTTVTEQMKDGWFKFSETAAISGTTWYHITIGNKSGWVSGSYFKPATAAAKYVMVNSNLVNVRDDANGSNIVTQVVRYVCYPFSDTKTVDGVIWYKIAVGDKTGWINGNYVVLADPDTSGTTGSTQSTTPSETKPTSSVASGMNYVMISNLSAENALRVRETPSTSAKVLASVFLYGWYPYTEVKTVNNVKWYKIITGNVETDKDNITGWISGDYATPATAAAKYLRMTGDKVYTHSKVSTAASTRLDQVRKFSCFPYTETSKMNGIAWYKITYNKSAVWISGTYAKPYTAPDYSSTSTTASTTSSTTTTSTTKPTVIEGTVRLQGSSRIETAVEICKQGWNSGSKYAILASSQSYADALAGVSLAAALDAPILLTSNEAALEPAIVDELTRLGVTNVYVLGGTGVISGTVFSTLSSKYTTTRLAGSNRYETAIAIAKELRTVTGKDFPTVFFASAENFPDALSISPVAGIEGSPVLYAPSTGSLDAATIAYLNSIDCTNAVIVGGPAAVSDTALASVMSCGFTNVKRYSGENRYETSLKINTVYNSFFAESGASMATGRNFPDALAGGALSAKYKLPVILIDNNVTVPNLSSYVVGRGYKPTYIYGGPNAVSGESVLAVIS